MCIRDRQKLAYTDYIETGFTSWGALQYFAELFEHQMKVIWLTRHPLSLIKSWRTHGLYQKPFLPHEQEKVFVLPSDRGVLYPEYDEHWTGMSQSEKILYYWLEVKGRAKYLKNIKWLPMLHIRYEDLFSMETINALMTFLDLPLKKDIKYDLDKLSLIHISEPTRPY